MKTSRLIRHMMWADVQAQRSLLVVWGLVLLAQALVFIGGPERIGTSPIRITYDTAAEVVRFIWTIVMIAMLIQSDGLVGTTAFWMTRPIPRAALLGSKLLSIALWCIATPIIVMTVALLWLGVGPVDALTGGGLIGLEQAVIVAMAIMTAAVTVNIGQFVVAGIAGVTLVSTFNVALLPALTLIWPSVGDAYFGSQPAMYAAVVIVGALAVLAVQIFTLREWRSVVLVAATMILATVVTRAWPADSLVTGLAAVPETVMAAGSVRLGVAPIAPRFADTAKGIGGKRAVFRTIQVETAPVGQPAGVYFWPVSADTTVTFSSRPPLRWSGATEFVPGPQESTDRTSGQPWVSIRAALGDASIDLPRRWVYYTTLADVPDAEFQARAGEQGSLTSTIDMVAYRYDVTTEAPLKAGQGLARPGHFARIESVTRTGPDVRIAVRETSLLGSRPDLRYGFGTSWYVLWNRSRNEAALLGWRTKRTFTATVGIAGTGVVTSRIELGLELAEETPKHVRIDAAWLEGAELAFVEPRALGLLRAPLVIDAITLPGKPTPRADTDPGQAGAWRTQARQGAQPAASTTTLAGTARAWRTQGSSGAQPVASATMLARLAQAWRTQGSARQSPERRQGGVR